MSDAPDSPSRPGPPRASSLEDFTRSHLFRVLSLVALVLVLQVPVGMIGRLIHERELRRDQAVAEVSGKWGHSQEVFGPLLIVLYSIKRAMTGSGENPREYTTEHHRTLLAEDLVIEGDVTGEVRSRGIFQVPLYDGVLKVRGRFRALDRLSFGAVADEIHWDRAVLAVRVSDVRAIQDAVTLVWGGRRVAFEPGLGVPGDEFAGIHARLRDPRSEQPVEFSFDVRLHGSGGLYFAPLGRDTAVTLRSDWPHPSFQGAWLPRRHEISDAGFTAHWQVPYLGRNLPTAWNSHVAPEAALTGSRFGVELATPVDPYRLSDRAAKYDLLFLGLTFLTLWLFEVLAGVRVHAMQYLLVGGAMSLFYLLLLALSEHVGVGLAYAIAAVGIVALIGCYAVSVLRQRSRAAAVGGVVAALYGYLFVLLHNEDHALLVGSLGLFAALAGVMWLTRRVDWFEALPPPGDAPAQPMRTSPGA